jgi:hypothetical protein
MWLIRARTTGNCSIIFQSIKNDSFEVHGKHSVSAIGVIIETVMLNKPALHNRQKPVVEDRSFACGVFRNSAKFPNPNVNYSVVKDRIQHPGLCPINAISVYTLPRGLSYVRNTGRLPVDLNAEITRRFPAEKHTFSW